MRTEAGTTGLLVVDLVLEVDDVDTQRGAGQSRQGAAGETGEAVVAGRHVLSAADGVAGGGALGVLAPAVAPGRPPLDLESPSPQRVEVAAGDHGAPHRRLFGHVGPPPAPAASRSIGTQWARGGTARPGTLAASSARRNATASAAWGEDRNAASSSGARGPPW